MILRFDNRIWWKAMWLGFSEWAPSVQRFVALVKVHVYFSITEGSIRSQVVSMIHLLDISLLLLSAFLVLIQWIHVQSGHSSRVWGQTWAQQTRLAKQQTTSGLLSWLNAKLAKSRSWVYALLWHHSPMRIIHPPGGKVIMLNSFHWCLPSWKRQ